MFRQSYIVFFTAFLFTLNFTNSQTLGRFGIKAGFLITGLGTSNVNEQNTIGIPKPFVSDSSFPFSYFSYDIGIFAE